MHAILRVCPLIPAGREAGVMYIGEESLGLPMIPPDREGFVCFLCYYMMMSMCHIPCDLVSVIAGRQSTYIPTTATSRGYSSMDG